MPDHSDNNLIKKWRQILTHPLTPTIISVAGLTDGFLGSIYTTEIKNAFPFGWGPYWSWPAFFFWLIFIVFSGLFFFRQRQVDAYEAQHQLRLITQAERLETLVRQSEQLENLVRTLPPEGFLSEFSKRYICCNAATNKVIFSTCKEIQLIEQAIRIILHEIATLAKLFDDAPVNTIYGANIMIFIPFNEKNGKQLEEIVTHIRFIDTDFDRKKLKGVLDLQTEFSSSTISSEPHQRDPDISSFALAITKEAKSENGRWKLLPGAPIAFTEKTLVVYKDSQELSRWCIDYGDFPISVTEELEKYFKSPAGLKIRSFASFPISDENNNVIGVVNIHRDLPNILIDRQGDVQFEPLMRPFTALLYDLINKRRELLRPQRRKRPLTKTK